MTKPFSPRESVARVEAVLRRTPTADAAPLRYADLYNTERAQVALGRVPPGTFLRRAPTPGPPSDFKLCA